MLIYDKMTMTLSNNSINHDKIVSTKLVLTVAKKKNYFYILCNATNLLLYQNKDVAIPIGK